MQILRIFAILFQDAIAKNLAGLLNDFFLQYYGPGDEQIGDTLKIGGLYASFCGFVLLKIPFLVKLSTFFAIFNV